MKCPFCNSEMIGEEGKRVCKRYPICGGHEVNTDNYNKSISKKELMRRKVE